MNADTDTRAGSKTWSSLKRAERFSAEFSGGLLSPVLFNISTVNLEINGTLIESATTLASQKIRPRCSRGEWIWPRWLNPPPHASAAGPGAGSHPAHPAAVPPLPRQKAQGGDAGRREAARLRHWPAVLAVAFGGVW